MFATKDKKVTGIRKAGGYVLALSLLLSACGDPGSPQAEDETAKQVSFRNAPPTELHRGNVAEPDTLDPHKMSTTYENVIGRDIFCSVADYTADGKLVPNCAESWTISDDGLTYTFKIRDGLTWTDGTPLTAADYVAGLRRVMDPATASEQAALFDMVKNAREVSYGQMPVEALAVSAPDDHTLVIQLHRPSPTFIRIYGAPRGAPLPRHVFEKFGDDWVKPGNMVSNGPFMLKDFRPHEFVHVVKNPGFWDADNVKLQDVYYYPTDDYNAAVKRFRAGELDLNNQLPTQQVSLLQEIMPDTVHIVPGLTVTYIIVNNERAPFNDQRVRRALSMAIDRPVITDKIMRMGEVPAFRFTPYVVDDYSGPEMDFKDWSMEERQTEARRLLAEAGFDEDNPLKFEYRIRATADGKRHATAIRSMWKEIGVEAEILGTEVKVHYADLREANFDVADAGWQSLNNPEDFLYLARTEAADQNYGNYSNPEFDGMMNEALAIPQIPERYALMAKAEQVMIDDVGIIPLYFGTNRNLVATYVKGYGDNAGDNHPSRYMWIDMGEESAEAAAD